MKGLHFLKKNNFVFEEGLAKNFWWIGHFPVTFKTGLVQNFSYENECNLHENETAKRGKTATRKWPICPSLETQGQLLVARWSQSGVEKIGEEKLERMRGAPGDEVLPRQFQSALWILASDWAEKLLCIFLPNQRAAGPQSVSCVLIWSIRKCPGAPRFLSSFSSLIFLRRFDFPLPALTAPGLRGW